MVVGTKGGNGPILTERPTLFNKAVVTFAQHRTSSSWLPSLLAEAEDPPVAGGDVHSTIGDRDAVADGAAIELQLREHLAVDRRDGQQHTSSTAFVRVQKRGQAQSCSARNLLARFFWKLG